MWRLGLCLIAILAAVLVVVAASGSPTRQLAFAPSPDIGTSIVHPSTVQVPQPIATSAPKVVGPLATTWRSEAAAATEELAVAGEAFAPNPTIFPLINPDGTSDTEDKRAGIGPVVPACSVSASVTLGIVPSSVSAGGVAGTVPEDLCMFASKYDAIRVANGLPIVTRFVYDSCMEQRLFWMAESPSSDPSDAWGHIGSVRIDGVPSVGCDGNLAGGSSNTGATVATKWWDSLSHRTSLYRPGSSVTGVCIAFAMTHGGNGDPYSFTRAAARWTSC